MGRDWERALAAQRDQRRKHQPAGVSCVRGQGGEVLAQQAYLRAAGPMVGAVLAQVEVYLHRRWTEQYDDAREDEHSMARSIQLPQRLRRPPNRTLEQERGPASASREHLAPLRCKHQYSWAAVIGAT